VGAESRAGQVKPFGQPYLSQDGVGGGSGNPPGDRRFTLLPGNKPLGEPIDRRRRLGARRQPEQPKSALGDEINSFLAEQARLRTEGKLTQPEDEPPIITPADASSLDLLEYRLKLDDHPEEVAKIRSVNRILWGFNVSAFGFLSQGVREYVTNGYELEQGISRNRPQVFEDMEKLNSEEQAILAEQLRKVGIPFKPLTGEITIPFALIVKKMREIVGGEPLFPHIPPPNVTHIKDHPRRNR